MSVSYHLNVDYNRSCVDYGSGNDCEGIVCPVDPRHQRAGRRITTLRIELRRKRIADFSSTMLADVIITDRALKCFRQAGFTGFEVTPTVVTRVPKNWDKAKTPKSWELAVMGTAGHAHPDSGMRLVRRCDACGSEDYSAYENGIIVDESQWDGSDFFTVVEKSRYYLVTERVKKTILESELTNAEFIPSHLLKWPESLTKPT